MAVGVVYVSGGLERQIRGHAAGLRTHTLVSLSAAIFVLACETMTADSAAEMTRVVQGIAAGVGFIGAGTILKTHHDQAVSGLTTATTIWSSAFIFASLLAVIVQSRGLPKPPLRIPLDRQLSRDCNFAKLSRTAVCLHLVDPSAQRERDAVGNAVKQILATVVCIFDHDGCYPFKMHDTSTLLVDATPGPVDVADGHIYCVDSILKSFHRA